MSKVVAFRDAKSNNPNTVNGKVSPPMRVTNAERRPREYLTPREVDRLIKAAGQLGRHQHRDKTLLLVTFRHALRVTELVNLRWNMVGLLLLASLNATTLLIPFPSLSHLRLIMGEFSLKLCQRSSPSFESLPPC